MSSELRTLAAATLLALGLGACGGGDGGGGNVTTRTSLGKPEGALNLIALPGYVEDGSTDPALDWVTPFERRTGCEVSQAVTESPGEVVRLLRSGSYDGVAARGDVSLRLADEGYVEPLNLDLIPNDADVFEGLRDLPSNTLDGISYGIPQGRQANLMLRRIPDVTFDGSEPTSWDVVFEPELASRYPGRVSANDGPLSIADAAIYLRDHEPDLGIEHPYELDSEQFEAALELLREQRPFVGRYWGSAAASARDFVMGRTLVGPAWRRAAELAEAQGLKVKLELPEEGASGVADSWMLAAEARHPSCMYLWMNHMLSPTANAAVAEHTSQAPSSERACDVTADVSHCDNYHAADEELFEDVEYWTTPLGDCGDDRGAACMDYRDWARAFAELRGAGPR